MNKVVAIKILVVKISKVTSLVRNIVTAILLKNFLVIRNGDLAGYIENLQIINVGFGFTLFYGLLC